MTTPINLTALRAKHATTDSLGGALRWPIDSDVALALIDTAEAAIPVSGIPYFQGLEMRRLRETLTRYTQEPNP